MRPDQHLEETAAHHRRPDPADYAEAIQAIGEWLAACPRTTNVDPIMLAELALEGADLDFTDDGDGWNYEQAMDDLASYSPQLFAAMARVRAARVAA